MEENSSSKNISNGKPKLTHRNAEQTKDPRQENTEENQICDNKVIAK